MAKKTSGTIICKLISANRRASQRAEGSPDQARPQARHARLSCSSRRCKQFRQEEALEEKYDALLESEKVDFDDSYDITGAASEKAEQFCRSLTITQVVSLVSANQEDVRDPRTVLVETLTEGRNKTGNDWNELRDSAAEDVATLIAGAKATDAPQEASSPTSL